MWQPSIWISISVFSTLSHVCVSVLFSRSLTGQWLKIVPVDVTSDWAELGMKLTCQTSVSAFYNELTFLYCFTHSISHCVYYWTPVFVSYWLFKNKHNLRNQKKNLCLTFVINLWFWFVFCFLISQAFTVLHFNFPFSSLDMFGDIYITCFLFCVQQRKNGRQL